MTANRHNVDSKDPLPNMKVRAVTGENNKVRVKGNIETIGVNVQNDELNLWDRLNFRIYLHEIKYKFNKGCLINRVTNLFVKQSEKDIKPKIYAVYSNILSYS